MHNQTAKKRTIKRDLEVFHISGKLVLMDFTLDQSRIKICLKQRKRMHIIFLQDRHVFLFVDLLIHLLLEFSEYIGQLSDIAAQFHSIPVWHTNIRHHHIRLVFFHDFQRLDSVVCMPDNGKSKLFPRNLMHNHLNNFFFIIYKK